MRRPYRSPAPIPSKIRNQRAGDACKNNFGDLIAVLRDERCRGHQRRKSRQGQSALGQKDVEENDQHAMMLDERNDVLHRL